ncbi:MAG: hypothetical protein O2807_00230 [bacterium]|nr:hypothetical protein [bacterium]
MSELRWNPWLERWALIATARRDRPKQHTFSPSTPAFPEPGCPFCPGNEAKTPPEIDAIRQGGRWSVRAFDNKFPALAPGLPAAPVEDGPFSSMPARGRHEVIVDAPDHCKGLGDYPAGHAADVLALLQKRVRALYGEPGIRAIVPYKNHGAAGGASLPHSHLQVAALPAIPPRTARERHAAEKHLRETGRPLLGETLFREREDGRRLVEQAEGAIAYCPFVSLYPYEIVIAPQPIGERFADASRETLEAVGGALARSLLRIKILLGDPPLNVLFHIETGPGEEKTPGAHHWHIEIIPRLTVLAGLELGAGVHINEAAPEEAAAALRGALS